MKKFISVLFIVAFLSVGESCFAQLVLPSTLYSRTCADVLADINAANGTIATLNTEKINAQSAYTTAAANAANAYANVVKYPLQIQYWQTLGAYYTSQMFWYGAKVGDIQYAIDQKTALLLSLQAEYSAKGC